MTVNNRPPAVSIASEVGVTPVGVRGITSVSSPVSESMLKREISLPVWFAA